MPPPENTPDTTRRTPEPPPLEGPHSEMSADLRATKKAAPKAKKVAQAKKAAQAKPATKPTMLSPQGAEFIGRFEGFRGAMYNDAAGHCTIGFGHLVHHGPINGTEPAEFKAGITRERAVALLQADAGIAAKCVRDNVKVPLNQPQFDALVSFIFNVGTGAFTGSTLLKKLNAGDRASVPGQLSQWSHAGGRVLQGLLNRRHAEGVLFSRGTYV
jgi:GH24 family phage-related lysozyme (muramidase)